MRRMKARSEHPRAVESSKEHEGKVDSKDFRGRAVRSAGIPPTADSKGGGPPEAREITRQSKLLETRTRTNTKADEGAKGDESIAPSTAEGGVRRSARLVASVGATYSVSGPAARAAATRLR